MCRECQDSRRDMVQLKVNIALCRVTTVSRLAVGILCRMRKQVGNKEEGALIHRYQNIRTSLRLLRDRYCSARERRVRLGKERS